MCTLGAVFTQIGGSEVEVMICDHDGRVAVATSMKLLQPLDPLEIEAKAMEIRVAFAWDVDIKDVVVGSDSKIGADTLLGLCTLPMVVCSGWCSSQASEFWISSNLSREATRQQTCTFIGKICQRNR